ncbi:MAG: hypothetical protein QXM35_04175 [Candidatus Methanomethylicia archaeon]
MSMQEELEGTRRLVFGLRKICLCAVEAEDDGIIMRPPVLQYEVCSNCSVMVLLCFLYNFKLRVLKTIEHCGVLCRGKTRYVIFTRLNGIMLCGKSMKNHSNS